jgi:hypothetical protein
MARYALYVRQPREVPWERREVYDSQAEAEARAAALVQGASDLEWGDDPARIDETIVVATAEDGDAPAELPADHVVPVVSRFSRQGLAG